MAASPQHKFRESVPELDRYGIAVRAFDRYVNLEPDPHALDVLLISFIAQGQARHQIEDAAFAASAGSVGVTRPGETHTIVTGSEGVRIYNIFLDPVQSPLPLMPTPLRTVQQVLFPPAAGFYTRLNRVVHFDVPDPDALERCVLMIDDESRQQRDGAEQIVAALRQIFIITCCRAARASGIEPAQSAPDWVLRVGRYLDDHFLEMITLDDLCDRFGLSKGYLCRGFKEYVGVTVMDYVVRRRVQAAMQALRGTDDKVLAIALDSGFNDLSHFNRTFKSHVGQTPTAYRRGSGAAPAVSPGSPA